jgi:hypothetical protein
MRKWTKLSIIIPLALLLTAIGLYVSLGVLVGLGYRMSEYERRPVECVSKELMVVLEKAFGLSFPYGITEIKTAKTAPREGVVLFFIKFDAEPITVDAFVRSFPGERHFREYKSSEDRRAKMLLFVPKWFTEPIRVGKMDDGPIIQNHNDWGMYIDTTDENKYIVYWSGYYALWDILPQK